MSFLISSFMLFIFIFIVKYTVGPSTWQKTERWDKPWLLRHRESKLTGFYVNEVPCFPRSMSVLRYIFKGIVGKSHFDYTLVKSNPTRYPFILSLCV